MFRRRRWPRALAAVAVLAAVVAVVLLLTRDGSDDRAGGPGGPTTAPSAQVTPGQSVGLAALLAASETELPRFEDGAVTATDVRVLRPVGPSTVWVGEGDRQVLVVFVEAEDAESLSPGTRVSFSGHVRRADPGFGEALGLSGEEAAAFERHRVYVEAPRYTRG